LALATGLREVPALVGGGPRRGREDAFGGAPRAKKRSVLQAVSGLRAETEATSRFPPLRRANNSPDFVARTIPLLGGTGGRLGTATN